MAEWVKLSDLRKGALFETRDGVRAVKSEYSYPYGGCECVLLESGEYAHFCQGTGRDALARRGHNGTEVREVVVPAQAVPWLPGHDVTPEGLAKIRRLLDAPRTDGRRWLLAEAAGELVGLVDRLLFLLANDHEAYAEGLSAGLRQAAEFTGARGEGP